MSYFLSCTSQEEVSQEMYHNLYVHVHNMGIYGCANDTVNHSKTHAKSTIHYSETHETQLSVHVICMALYIGYFEHTQSCQVSRFGRRAPVFLSVSREVSRSPA